MDGFTLGFDLCFKKGSTNEVIIIVIIICVNITPMTILVNINSDIKPLQIFCVSVHHNFHNYVDYQV